VEHLGGTMMKDSSSLSSFIGNQGHHLRATFQLSTQTDVHWHPVTMCLSLLS